MSYILDALRKADAERERDPARGIHAQPLAGVEPPEQRPSSVKGAWMAAAAVLAAWAAYGFWSHEAAPPVVAVVPAPQVAAPTVLVAPAPAPANVVMPPAPPMVVPVVAPPAVPNKAAPVPLASATDSARTTPAKAGVVKGAAPATVAVAPAAAAPDQPAASRVFALAELPADVQRELPKFAITGGVHSDNVAQRMLIVGGQVLNEGSEVAPGVVLEQIRARTAVLRFRSYRFSVGY